MVKSSANIYIATSICLETELGVLFMMLMMVLLLMIMSIYVSIYLSMLMIKRSDADDSRDDKYHNTGR